MNEDLKKIFQDHASIHESSVDPQEIWDGIQLKRKNPRRNRIIYMLPILLGLFLVCFLLNPPIKNTNPAPLSEVLTENEHELLESQNDFHNTISESSVTNHNSKKTASSTMANLPQEKEENLNFPKTNFTTNTNVLIEEPKTSFKENEKNPQNQQRKKKDENQNPIISRPDSLIHLALPHHSVLLASTSIQTLSFELKNPKIINIDLATSFTPSTEVLNLPKSKYTIALTAGGGILTKRYLEIDQALKEARVSGEDALDFYSVGMMLSYNMSRHISFTTGVTFSRLYEKQNRSTKYLQDPTGEISLIELDTEGQPAYNFSNGDYFIPVQENFNVYNTYSLVELPIELALRKSFGRFTSTLGLGTSFFIRSRNKGYQLNESGTVSTLENLNTTIDKKFNLRLNVGIQYNLSQYLSLSLSIHRNEVNVIDTFSSYQLASYGSQLGFLFTY